MKEAWTDSPQPLSQSRGWFPIVLAGLCGIGLGILLGLATASIGGNSLAEMTMQNEALTKQLSASARAKHHSGYVADTS